MSRVGFLVLILSKRQRAWPFYQPISQCMARPKSSTGIKYSASVEVPGWACASCAKTFFFSVDGRACVATEEEGILGTRAVGLLDVWLLAVGLLELLLSIRFLGLPLSMWLLWLVLSVGLLGPLLSIGFLGLCLYLQNKYSLDYSGVSVLEFGGMRVFLKGIR